MYHQKWLYLLFPLFALGSVFLACTKSNLDNVEIAEHSAAYAFPLFTTSLSLKELMFKVLNDSLSGDTIVVNPDNTMTLYYSGDVAEKPASDIFNFFQTGLVPVADTLYDAPLKAPDSVTIRQANLSGGTINVVINNPFPEQLSGTFFIPQMTKNNMAFAYPFTIPPGLPIPSISPTIDLTGYILRSDSNTLQFRYEAYLPDGKRVMVPEISPGTPGVGIVFNSLTFSYLEGYWGFTEYPLTLDTIDIDINQTNLKGNVKVKDPKVTMTVANSWGFPTRGVIKYLSFIGQDGQEYKLESALFNGDSVDFRYPSWAANEVGQTKYTDLVLDGQNSNIATIFNAQPTQLIYEVAGISNADRDPSIVGFLTDESTIALRMSVELVLEGSAQNFGAEQSLNLNFGDYGDIDTAHIEEVEFKLVTENGTPVSTAMQLYFQDENGASIDSLFVGEPQFIMNAAPVDANGNVTGSNRTETFVPMDITRFDRVRKTKTVFLKTFFTTANGGTVPVKLLATQQAAVKLGLKIKTRY